LQIDLSERIVPDVCSTGAPVSNFFREGFRRMQFARVVGWLLVILAAAPGFAAPIDGLIAAAKKEAL
jgi:hypothetical protein